MTTDPLAALADAQANLDQAHHQADQLQLIRDRAIVAARDSGATWSAIQQTAHMTSPRSVAKAIERAEVADSLTAP